MVSKAKPAPYKHVPVVEVYLWGKRMGAVTLDPAYGYYAFSYTPEFIASGIEPAPLQMPTSKQGVFLFTDLAVDTYKRLPALLGDALPDDFGNALINRHMAEKGISATEVTALDRLAYMNNRAMGALQFKPSRGPKTKIPTAIELSQLVNQARDAVQGIIAGDEHANATLRSIIEVGPAYFTAHRANTIFVRAASKQGVLKACAQGGALFFRDRDAADATAPTPTWAASYFCVFAPAKRCWCDLW